MTEDDLLGFILGTGVEVRIGETHQMANWRHRDVAQVVDRAYSRFSFEQRSFGVKNCFNLGCGYGDHGNLLGYTQLSWDLDANFPERLKPEVRASRVAPNGSVILTPWDRFSRQYYVTTVPIAVLPVRYRERANQIKQATETEERRRIQEAAAARRRRALLFCFALVAIIAAIAYAM